MTKQTLHAIGALALGVGFLISAAEPAADARVEEGAATALVAKITVVRPDLTRIELSASAPPGATGAIEIFALESSRGLPREGERAIASGTLGRPIVGTTELEPGVELHRILVSLRQGDSVSWFEGTVKEGETIVRLPIMGAAVYSTVTFDEKKSLVIATLEKDAGAIEGVKLLKVYAGRDAQGEAVQPTKAGLRFIGATANRGGPWAETFRMRLPDPPLEPVRYRLFVEMYADPYGHRLVAAYHQHDSKPLWKDRELE